LRAILRDDGRAGYVEDANASAMHSFAAADTTKGAVKK